MLDIDDNDRKTISNIVKGTEHVLDHNELFEKLFEHYLPIMPYGTAKARTGCPGEFIHNELRNSFEKHL